MPTDPTTSTEHSGGETTPSSRWSVFAVLALIAGGVVIALLTQDRVREAVAIGGVLSTYALALLLLGRRSETMALLSGDVSDERRRSITMRANAVTGAVMTTVVVGAFIISLINGTPDLDIYAGLCASAGAAYIGATASLSVRLM